MNKIITEKIAQLEQDRSIRILFACESGSRAWGFPSPDSDYDVRFIYAHPEDWYFAINEKEDVVELPVNEVLDINGWDIRKALRLLAKSNSVLFEWIQSPIIYRQDKIFISGLKEIAPSCFSPIASMHHYLSMAKKKFEESTAENDVKLKRYMYCLRAVLSCLWIAHRKSIPPMELSFLLAEMPDTSLKIKIQEMVLLKATRDESYRHSRDSKLEQFFTESLAECETVAQQLPSQKANYDRLNDFLRQNVRQ